MNAQNIGSSFDDFLAGGAMLTSATVVAVKRVIAWQIAREMRDQKMTKTRLAEKMHTSRASLNRLLDDNDSSLTLTTLVSAAAALGKKVKIELISE
ncbi:helix-turn-helix domain-containing protein [Massilia glaciei]|uniref:Helix-turn-helix domain-containing protein n=1 Tax=Massilia glaciei TaxID=1524097 RepID=A0A2U2HEI0_9BURK|nr:helix-turn-helix transcriptional regulator [Massilia glaciei]PWF42049.1 helix-turn-helix domain-containing protein [Massilia glaciei]